MNDYDPGFLTWRHRLVAGKVESRVFNSNEVPKGWVETVTELASVPVTPEPIPEPEFHIGSGETLDVGSNPEPVKTKRRPGRPRKVRDGDDS